MTIHIVPLIIFGAAIFLLYSWSKELTERRFSIILYFLVSTYIAPLFSRYNETGGSFELWFPLGFALVVAYLFISKNHHSAKWKASLLGLAIAIIKLIQEYSGFMITFKV